MQEALSIAEAEAGATEGGGAGRGAARRQAREGCAALALVCRGGWACC
jgi:hypothetical protein